MSSYSAKTNEPERKVLTLLPVKVVVKWIS